MGKKVSLADYIVEISKKAQMGKYKEGDKEELISSLSECFKKSTGLDMIAKDWMYGDLQGVEVNIERISRDKMNPNKFNLVMEAIDISNNPPKKITQNFKRALVFGEQGMEIYNQELYKDSKYDGKVRISEVINDAQARFVKKVNEKAGAEKCQMTVCAQSNSATDKDNKVIGAYFWAINGFDFKNEEERNRIVGKFAEYCENKKTPISSDQLSKMTEACDVAIHPMGKDFLMDSVEWHGVYKGHIPETKTAKVMTARRAARDTSKFDLNTLKKYQDKKQNS